MAGSYSNNRQSILLALTVHPSFLALGEKKKHLCVDVICANVFSAEMVIKLN